LTNLRGKIIIILFYQSWCPVCNKWAPDFIKQMQEQYVDQPGYVLIGLKTDGGTPEEAKEFLADKGADLSAWVIATDEEKTYYKAFMNDTPLWGYAVITPEGERLDQGKAGAYYLRGKGNNYVLPQRRAKEFDTMFPDTKRTFLPSNKTYAPELKEAVRFAETGRFLSALNQAFKVGGDTAKEFQSDMDTLLNDRVAKLEQQARDVNHSERYAAVMILRDMATQMKSMPPGKAAQKIVSELSKDKAIQREEKAEKAWQTLMKAIEKQPPEKRQAALAANIPSYIKTYENTHFANVAKATVTK
jgi:thiol-disulfide isomerase/thioredoxin